MKIFIMFFEKNTYIPLPDFVYLRYGIIY